MRSDTIAETVVALPDVDPALTEPHLSNRVTAALVEELDATVSRSTVDDILDELGLPRQYASNPENWVSTELARRFAEELARRVYGLDTLPGYDHEMWQHWRRAAQRALHPDVVGPIFAVLRAFGSPERFYRGVPRLHRRATSRRVSKVHAVGTGQAVISIRPAPEGEMEAHNCWFQRGLFEAVPTLWGLPAAEVEHRECMLDPKRSADACVYRIRFEQRRGWLGLATIAWIGAGAVVGAVLGLVIGVPLVLMGLTGAAVGAAVVGFARAAHANRVASYEARELERLLRQADERQAELWDEHMALRRSMLVAQKLSGYLASDLTERILQHPELQLELGASYTDAAVLFIDIVGFTPRCASMDPAHLVEELNVYFRHVDPNVVENHGVIDKRIGDGIMAVFVPREDDPTDVAVRALRCAMGMLRSLRACNAELHERGAEPFQARIGIANGELVQGNMGSPVRLEYTVIGDIVNLAARFEAVARPDHALVPAALVDALAPEDRDALVVSKRRPVQVKGLSVEFEVLDVRPASAQ